MIAFSTLQTLSEVDVIIYIYQHHDNIVSGVFMDGWVVAERRRTAMGAKF